ncbi:DUF4352 domain-containing protein [Phytohabitans rumicis]|uniref:DUF4352 domain-containing protein n=1 Tax=Phytohabitans rumicis TaxID=1076125 RepID=A0A6V8LC47_9ACTN|nr:DUF4352 domain-containing protein [Phytohabitans rumicis]GFJ90255.1 hypothetical protein Prum_038970 [Phytohabitans rumicis]
MNPPGTDPEQVRSHRAPPGPVQRAGTRASVGSLVVAALAVGGLVANWRPVDGARADARERPYISAGQVGDSVSARSFEAKVLEVRGAKVVGFRGTGHDTDGVWILVQVRITATTEDTLLNYAALVDDKDRVYRATGRFDQPFTAGRTLQPGIPVEGEIAFEVPRDVATSLRIRLAAPLIDQRMDGMAEIELPKFDTATIDKWATNQEPVIFKTPAVAP